MSTRVKIKICDDSPLRMQLDDLYDQASQVRLCRYVLLLADHIFRLVQYPDITNEVIQAGYAVNKSWQRGEARMHDVRQAGFQIHQLAKACGDPLHQTALRVAGQAVSTGHMSEHAMVASDYAVKAINLKYPGDREAVIRERRWQIALLKDILSA